MLPSSSQRSVPEPCREAAASYSSTRPPPTVPSPHSEAKISFGADSPLRRVRRRFGLLHRLAPVQTLDVRRRSLLFPRGVYELGDLDQELVAGAISDIRERPNSPGPLLDFIGVIGIGSDIQRQKPSSVRGIVFEPTVMHPRRTPTNSAARITDPVSLNAARKDDLWSRKGRRGLIEMNTFYNQ
jgi:hypothetical protein